MEHLDKVVQMQQRSYYFAVLLLRFLLPQSKVTSITYFLKPIVFRNPQCLTNSTTQLFIA